MLFGDSVREMAADQFTASYDRLYAVKEHDIEGKIKKSFLFYNLFSSLWRNR